MISPIVIQLVKGGFSVGMKAQVVVGDGLGSAVSNLFW